ncbi:MAG TPA: thioredoxin family protein [Gammaproteobacteria bacterium]|nr:thioredoxin family protein [Gammaproteobacteria bacterium]
MKTYLTLLFLFSFSSQTVLSDGLPQYSLHYDPKRDAMQDGREAIQLAKQTNRRILIEVGGDWCKWCHLLDRFLNKNPALKAQLHQTFVLLKVNVSEENENADFLKVFPPALGYPHMYVTESNGKLLLSKDTGEFLINGHYSKKRFQAFFNKFKLKQKRHERSII